MSRFRVVLIEHGYSTVEHERRIISAAGGELIDAEFLPLPEALRLCEEADGILCRRLEISAAMLQKFVRCKILVRYGVGTDNVDVKTATSAGIMIGHVSRTGGGYLRLVPGAERLPACRRRPGRF